MEPKCHAWSLSLYFTTGTDSRNVTPYFQNIGTQVPGPR